MIHHPFKQSFFPVGFLFLELSCNRVTADHWLTQNWTCCSLNCRCYQWMDNLRSGKYQIQVSPYSLRNETTGFGTRDSARQRSYRYGYVRG
ncbi:hypothetical protein BDP27DRAFT_1309847 [Rhodocollybia butyracea]|uniref:Secreted protein n=1 Tax=Rhodocollybia butyracea TaxID=206335 RepID=A0A9P5QBW2_9AGAR|nr:hypothetical protein BDP27DRAFT_1309847 [Rhodocollybia butyracea]